MTRADLIAALEKAEGPSMALSREIAKLAGWHRVEPRHMHHRSKHGAWISPIEWNGRDSDGRPILDSLRGTEMHRDPPHYTASIDAALTLVSAGGLWTISHEDGPPFARLMMPTKRGDYVAQVYRESHGATPAIALCIAALKAALPTDTERPLTDEDRAAIASDPFAMLKARE